MMKSSLSNPAKPRVGSVLSVDEVIHEVACGVARTFSITCCCCATGSSFFLSTLSDIGKRTSSPPYESVLTYTCIDVRRPEQALRMTATCAPQSVRWENLKNKYFGATLCPHLEFILALLVRHPHQLQGFRLGICNVADPAPHNVIETSSHHLALIGSSTHRLKSMMRLWFGSARMAYHAQRFRCG